MLVITHEKYFTQGRVCQYSLNNSSQFVSFVNSKQIFIKYFTNPTHLLIIQF